jgi:hypothetical protein
MGGLLDLVLEYIGDGLYGDYLIVPYVCKGCGWGWVLQDLHESMSGLNGHIGGTAIWYWRVACGRKFNPVRLLFALVLLENTR